MLNLACVPEINPTDHDKFLTFFFLVLYRQVLLSKIFILLALVIRCLFIYTSLIKNLGKVLLSTLSGINTPGLEFTL